MKKKVDLLHEPILPGLTRLAVPIMATSLVQMAYNLTDMAWIGRLGAGAVTAVGTAGMYSWLSQGIVDLAKIGGQVKVAHALGAGNEKDAAQYAKCAIQMGLLFAVMFGLISFFGAKYLIGFFGLKDPVIIANSQNYLRIVCGLILFPYINSVLTGILTANGDSKTPFKANVIGLAANMVLDPVLIFGIGPFPAMGVVGAAVATVTAQITVSFIFILAVRKEEVLFGSFRLFTVTPVRYIKEIVTIGFPASIQNLIYASISMVLTRLVTGWGDTAVAIQRVGGQVESVSWMVGEGFAAAVNSFTGQNFGAGLFDRVKKGFSAAVKMMGIWGLMTTSLLIFLAEPIFSIFIREPDVLGAGVEYLRILGLSQFFMLIELTSFGAFAGLGKTSIPSVLSIILTSARIPLAIVFSSMGLGLNGIWWALTVSSVAKGIIFYIAYKMTLRKVEKRMGPGLQKTT